MTILKWSALLLAVPVLASGAHGSFAQDLWPREVVRPPVPSSGHSGAPATSSGNPLGAESNPDMGVAPLVNPETTGSTGHDVETAPRSYSRPYRR
ncbi:hypothetical protein [Methylobacterium nigriterrae]|uniref:hypothetical protein n=1 Tax=Methylobacterium nigriterrae TaxID=3127512 RepID=UPI0030132833